MIRSPSLAAVRWLLGRYARPFAGAITLMTLATFVGNILTVLQPVVLAGLLANVSGSATAAIPPGTSLLNLNYLGPRITTVISARYATEQALVVFGVMFLVLAVLIAVLSYLAEAGAAWLKVRITNLIQQDVLQHLLSQDMAFFTRQHSGELMSRMTTDAGSTANALGPLVRSLLQPAIQLVVYSVYLFSTSWSLTLGALVLLATQFGVTQLLRRPTRLHARRETDRVAELMTALQEAFTGIRVTKSFGAERFELAKINQNIRRLGNALLRKSRFEKIEIPVRSVLDSIAVLGIFFIAIAQMRRGALTFEGLILFTYVGRLLIAPINAIATNALWVETLGASFGRIQEMLSERPTVVDGTEPKRTFDRDIQFVGVTFTYDGGRKALDNVSLDIRQGELIALVGPSGAGKSTFADLVLRLYDPTEGDVLMDGISLRRLRQSEYRRLFGVVSQESLLFNDTVRNNIRYGRNELTDADIIDAARAAHAHDFIVSLAQGYDSVVGDRGVRLSGGERQRVAIARALVHRPKILILDEATSALDSESERQVQQAINEIVTQTTAIIIAHRLSTVTHADRIVVLNEGRVEAIGSHATLLGASPTYRLFCAVQFRQPDFALPLAGTGERGGRPA